VVQAGECWPLGPCVLRGHPRHYDAKSPESFAPVVRVAFSECAEEIEEEAWAPSEPIFMTPAFDKNTSQRERVRVLNRRAGYENLLSHRALQIAGVRHLALTDYEPPCLLLNQTPHPLFFYLDAHKPVSEEMPKEESKAPEPKGPSSPDDEYAVASSQCTEFDVVGAPVPEEGLERRFPNVSLHLRLPDSTWSLGLPLRPGRYKKTVARRLQASSSSPPSLSFISAGPKASQNAQSPMILLDIRVYLWRGSLVLSVTERSGGVDIVVTSVGGRGAGANPWDFFYWDMQLEARSLSMCLLDEERTYTCAGGEGGQMQTSDEELVNVSFQNIHTRMSLSPPRFLTQEVLSSALQVSLAASSPQIDNQQAKGEFPVVLKSTAADINAQALKLRARFEMPVAFSPTSPFALRSLDCQLIDAALPTLVVNLEDAFLFRVADVALPIVEALVGGPSSSATDAKYQAGDEYAQVRETANAAFWAALAVVAQPRVAIRRLSISPIDLRLTVRSSLAAQFFVGVGQMPVLLNAVELDAVCCAVDPLVRELLAKYLADAVVRTPMLLGSLDLLGNPTFLVQSLGKGLHDLVALPKNALPEGPTAFVRALGGGVISLLQHAGEGSLTSVSGFSNSLARNVDQLSPEDLFSFQREVARASPPSGVSGGILRGVTTLGQSVAGGLIGVLSSPYHGASHDGTWGFFKGVSGGLLGMVTKPVSGMLDLVSHTSKGLAGAVRLSDAHAGATGGAKTRARPPVLQPLSNLELFFTERKLRSMCARYGETLATALLAMSYPTTSGSAGSQDGAQEGEEVLVVDGPVSLVLITNRCVRVWVRDRPTLVFPFEELQYSCRLIKQAVQVPGAVLDALAAFARGPSPVAPDAQDAKGGEIDADTAEEDVDAEGRKRFRLRKVSGYDLISFGSVTQPDLRERLIVIKHAGKSALAAIPLASLRLVPSAATLPLTTPLENGGPLVI
jgi:hypothetical protein